MYLLLASAFVILAKLTQRQLSSSKWEIKAKAHTHTAAGGCKHRRPLLLLTSPLSPLPSHSTTLIHVISLFICLRLLLLLSGDCMGAARCLGSNWFSSISLEFFALVSYFIFLKIKDNYDCRQEQQAAAAAATKPAKKRRRIYLSLPHRNHSYRKCEHKKLHLYMCVCLWDTHRSRGSQQMIMIKKVK